MKKYLVKTQGHLIRKYFTTLLVGPNASKIIASKFRLVCQLCLKNRPGKKSVPNKRFASKFDDFVTIVVL